MAGVKPKRLVSYPLSLALVVAALILATGGWIAWWNYRAGLANTRALAFELFGQVAHQTADSTAAFLAKAPPAAETLRNFSADEPSAMESVIARREMSVLRANPSFTWVSFADPAGRFVGAYYPTPGQIRINQSSISDGKTSLVESDVVGDAWKEVRRDPDSKYDPRTRPYYPLAAAAGRGVWAPPYVFFEKVPGITYAVPQLDATGLRGVYTVDFDLGRLSELARALHPSEHGVVAIVADDGTMLAHPTAKLATADGKLVLAKDVADPALRALVAAGRATRELAVAGTPYLASSVDIHVPDGPAWRVVVYAPERDFTAALDGRVVSSLVVSLLAVVIAVVIAWVLARRVSGPLTALAEDMSRVGEFRIDDQPAQHSAFREIELMNRALAKMKSSLRSFGRFVPRDLVRTLLASGREATLSGELRTLTVYFSDLAGFTSLGETMKPDELVRFLGTYFEDTSRIIAEERGTVDKYLGDGTMAFWGAPEEVADHAVRACAAALRCHRRVKELAAGGTKISARIGIATGEVLVGNIGSPERMNYTVMGDTANLAARLESLNKQYATELMIGEQTYELAKGSIVARALDVVAVKGKQRGVRVYELLALASDRDARAEAIAADSTIALDAYLARDFATAVAAWDRVLARLPEDRAATQLRDRARGYLDATPGPEWTGVTVATEK